MTQEIKPVAFIAATASSFPGEYYKQDILCDALCEFLEYNKLNFQSDIARRLFKSVDIKGRYFGFPVENFCNPDSIENSAIKAIDMCADQAEINVRSLLTDTGLKPHDIAQIVSVTLTPAVPTIEARLMNRIAFPHDMKRMPLAGLGCMAGVAGVSRALDYLRGHPEEALILISCELSSALWQGSVQEDLTTMIGRLEECPELYSEIMMAIVTAALFGDGSGALLIVGPDHALAKEKAAIALYDSRSNCVPNTENIMGLDLIDRGFRNILRPEVKSYVKFGVQQVVEPILKANNFNLDDIGDWVLHPGGPKIMDAVEQVYNLPEQDMLPSRETLREIGNISSATVLYMIDQKCRNARPDPGTKGLLVAMGPGFSQESVLLGW